MGSAVFAKGAIKNPKKAFPESANEGFVLEGADSIDINYTEQVKKLQGSLFIDSTEKAQIIINKQQEADMKDIENLWNAAVENNPVIKFSLKKLSIPEEQRRIHSSLMAKSASALISGASMIPSFMGANYAVQSASFASARLANNFINKDNQKNMADDPLTDTEVIELAVLIEDLQDEIVTSYYNYKASLMRLKACREQLLLYNKNYSEALRKKDSVEIVLSSALWQDGLIEEYALVQDVKKYQLLLQRLSGREAMNALSLTKYDLSIGEIDPSGLNLEKRKINVSN
ncbi:hypothetical protein tpqmel_0012 [Candidatus Gastranaerophilus sp. (ex Termes propinquus)]|nr:hypothetical protein tpqmel_0012 [Candidatus Gastranaerophilus sp. (ex Termes propinquus)]